MEVRQEAHRYADAGLYVIPVRHADKRPAIKTGPEHRTAATVSHKVIDAWWEAHPEWGVAIVCSPSRLVVVDVDGPTGEETLARLEYLYGPTPTTWQSSTPNGRHLLYRWPTDLPVRTTIAGPKLDIRGAGSYIVAPPSVHPSGNRYMWDRTDVAIAAAPTWLVAGRSDSVEGANRSVSGTTEFAVDVNDNVWAGLEARFRFAGRADVAETIKALFR